MTVNVLARLSLLAVSIVAVSCGDPDSEPSASAETAGLPRILYDFEADELPADVKLIEAEAVLTGEDVASGGQALIIRMNSAATSYSGVFFAPDQPWDWSDLDDFHLAIDIANRGAVSAQLYLDIEDIDGAVYTRSVSVPTGPARTYYAKMAGHDLAAPDGDESIELNFSSGLRSNPATWESDAAQFVSLWGKKNLNLAGIRRLTLNVRSALHDKQITIDNVRLRANPRMDDAFLAGIVDQYGQNANAEFVGKVHSDDELKDFRDRELAELAAAPTPPGRSKFGGWSDGPRLDGTGYFRAEKVDDKWALVDPEGYLFFATGLDIIRLSNSTTMTGYDVDHELVPSRQEGDLTPEDSIGLNPVPEAALPTRRVVSAVRADMFRWLPAYEDPLGNHYGYRREAHSGPVKRGESFSFYSANLERKYGEQTPGAYLDRWEEVTIDRMLSWGFTSLGNWTDPRFYDQQRIPYFANGWIIGNFRTVSSGNDFWSPMPDVFDPVFEERARATVSAIADDVKGSPWCVGVFIDNEKSFGRSETDESRLGIVIHTLARDGAEVPTKREFTRLLREKYGSIDALNAAWQIRVDSWDEFDAGFESAIDSAPQLADYSDLLHAYASEYFAVVQRAMREFMPDHLYLGSRFPDWGMPMEVVTAAAKYADVVSYNSYKEGLPDYAWQFLADIDKPSIIGEFHIGASDAGLFHPGLVHAADQEDRARMYTEYMQSVIDNPYFVGAHWFQYIDSPLTGRAYDGENYNVGFVSVTDVPYQPMVEAARALHREMYARRFAIE